MKRYKSYQVPSAREFTFVINKFCPKCSNGKINHYENGINLEGTCYICDGEGEIEMQISVPEIVMMVSNYISSNPTEISKFINAFGIHFQTNPQQLMSFFQIVKTIFEVQVEHVVDS